MRLVISKRKKTKVLCKMKRGKSCFTGKLRYVFPNPSLSGLSALLSVDLLHRSDHKAQEQEVHLGVASVQFTMLLVTVS